MPKQVVIQADLARLMQTEWKLKKIGWTKQPIKIEIDFDKGLYAKLDEDPLLQAKLWEAASECYYDFIAKCKKTFTATDKQIISIENAVADLGPAKTLAKIKTAHKKMGTDIMAHQKNLEKAVPKAVMDAWKKIVAKNKSYRNYKIKSVVSIGLRTAAVTFAVIGLFSNPFTIGPGLLALQTLCSGVLSVYNDTVKLAKAAEPFREKTEKKINALQKRYLKSGKAALSGKDFSATMFKTVFGMGKSTISSCQKDVKQYLKKLIGVDQNAHKVALELNKALKAMDKMPRRGPDAIVDLNTPMTKLAASMTELLNTVVQMEEQITKGEKWAAATEPLLKALADKKYVAVTVIEKLFTTALAASKVGVDYQDVGKLAKSGMKIAGNAVKGANGLYHNYQMYEKERQAVSKKLKSLAH